MKNLFTILLVANSIIAQAQVCFTTNNIPLEDVSTTIISADFNNDGKPDLATGIDYRQNIYISLGDGLGGFGAPSLVPTNSSIMGLGPIISGDFNTDGNQDLAIAKITSSGIVQILFGDGKGNFPTTNSLAVGGRPGQLCSADFNRDGYLDIATVISNSISIILGDGTGNFTLNKDFSVGSSAPASICSGDFNGDSKIDLAVASDIGGGLDSVCVLLGDGDGNFGAVTKYLADTGPYSVCSQDFNSDGFMDLAVANSNSNNVSVFLSKGASGLFNTATNYKVVSSAFSVISTDYNGDGIPDLAVGNYGGHSVSILLGKGDGTFGSANNFAAGSGIWSIISADFNSDGRPDIATANHDNLFTSILLNKFSANCIGCALNAAVPIPNICMVTTESETSYKYNVVKWDKSPYINSNVDSFVIYRKDAITSKYLRIGAVSINSLSQLVDTAFSIGGPNGGNPEYSSWLYKLAIIDICGNVGAMSPFHQSMFFQQNGSNFSWNPYIVEAGQTNPLTGYSFLRDDNNSGNWHVLVNTLGTTTTDPNFASFPNGNWRIDALGFNCTPTAKTSSSSHSNTSKLLVTGLSQISEPNEKIVLYPNPFSFQATLQTTDPLKNATLIVDNYLGQTVKQIKNLSGQTVTFSRDNLPNGMYFLRLTENNKTLTVEKLVITD